jgi:hypothetical protein
VGNGQHHQDRGAHLVHENAVLIRAPREFLTHAPHGPTVTISTSTLRSVEEIRLIDSARSGVMVPAMLRLASPWAGFESVRFSRDTYRRARRRADGDFWSAMQVLGVVPHGCDVALPAVDSAVSGDGGCPAVCDVDGFDWCSIFWWLC